MHPILKVFSPKKVVLFFLFLGFFLFYFWTASNGNLKSLKEVRWGGASSYPMMLAESFLKGQTYLATKPKPELLALPDPYDPNFNDHYRLHDASLYQGKYYLYFSPVVSILILAPIRYVTGFYLSDTFLTCMFACISLIFSCLVINQLFKIANIKPTFGYLIACYLALAMLTNIPFLSIWGR